MLLFPPFCSCPLPLIYPSPLLPPGCFLLCSFVHLELCSLCTVTTVCMCIRMCVLCVCVFIHAGVTDQVAVHSWSRSSLSVSPHSWLYPLFLLSNAKTGNLSLLVTTEYMCAHVWIGMLVLHLDWDWCRRNILIQSESLDIRA